MCHCSFANQLCICMCIYTHMYSWFANEQYMYSLSVLNYAYLAQILH